MVYPGDAYMWPLIFFEDLVQGERHAISRRAVYRPVTGIDLANAQRARKCKTVGSSTHFCRRRNHVHITQLAKGSFQRAESVGMYAVVVR